MSEWIKIYSDRLAAIDCVPRVKENVEAILLNGEAEWRNIKAAVGLTLTKQTPLSKLEFTITPATKNLVILSVQVDHRKVDIQVSDQQTVLYYRQNGKQGGEGSGEPANGTIWANLFRWVTFGQQNWDDAVENARLLKEVEEANKPAGE